MSKILVICLAILAIGSLACSSSPADYSKPDMVITATLPEQNPVWEASNEGNVWVFPASIQIGAVGPEQESQHYIKGIKIVYPLVIHAASDEPIQFHLSYQGLSYTQVSSTYSSSPARAINWVQFPEPDPYLAANETREVPVEFFVPKNEPAPARWEFLVRVDWEQSGYALQARAILFQINMRT